MNQTVTTLWPLMTAGFGVAVVHAALPTHWLPFVLAGRAQGWSPGKTMMVTTLAGGGHVLFTAVLGLLAVGAGMAVNRWSAEVFPWLAGSVLVAFGVYYLWRQVSGRGHGHSHVRFTPAGAGHDHGHAHHAHSHHDHPHPDHAPVVAASVAARSDAAVILGLLAILTFSPCEGFVPMFVAGAQHGWGGYVGLSAVLAAATLLGMLVFTWLTLKGMEHLGFEGLARYEQAIVGAMLLAIGIGIWVLET